MTMFPKPKDQKREAEAVRVFKDGREVCNRLTKAGRDEYALRKYVMYTRQGGRCILFGHCPTCPGQLRRIEAMFEHQDGRGHGGAIRDDRIEKIDPKTGEMRPYNGVAHPLCNVWKGSRRIDYHDTQPAERQDK